MSFSSKGHAFLIGLVEMIKSVVMKIKIKI